MPRSVRVWQGMKFIITKYDSSSLCIWSKAMAQARVPRVSWFIWTRYYHFCTAVKWVGQISEKATCQASLFCKGHVSTSRWCFMNQFWRKVQVVSSSKIIEFEAFLFQVAKTITAVTLTVRKGSWWRPHKIQAASHPPAFAGLSRRILHPIGSGIICDMVLTGKNLLLVFQWEWPGTNKEVGYSGMFYHDPYLD